MKKTSFRVPWARRARWVAPGAWAGSLAAGPQGLIQGEATEVLGVSVRTVQRRLNRSLVLLVKELEDLRPN